MTQKSFPRRVVARNYFGLPGGDPGHAPLENFFLKGSKIG